MAVTSISTVNAVYYFDGAKMITDSTYKYYRAWSQDQFPWHNTKPSDAWEADWTNRYGCSLMAMSKMFVEAGITNPKTTNPYTIIKKYGSPSQGIGDIGMYWSTLAGHYGMTCESFQYYPKGSFYDTAMSFFRRTDHNYHLLLRVELSHGGPHYVQVDRQATIDSGEIIFNDSTNTQDGGTRYNSKEDYWKNCALKNCSQLGFTPVFFVVFYNDDTLKMRSIEEVNSTTAKITWYPNGCARSYVVYRRKKGAKNWVGSKIATVKHVKGEGIRGYVDKGLVMGQLYEYTVKGVYTVGGKEYSIGYDKNGKVFQTHPDPPVLKSAESVNMSTIKVSWETVKNADGYKIYRRKSNEKTWTALKTGITGTTYLDKTAKCGQKYYYTVRAYKGDKNFLGAFDKTGLSAMAVPETPKLLDAESIDFSTIKVSWNQVEGVDGYYIYRKTGSLKFQKIGEVSKSKTEFSDLSPICGQKYTYTVKAYKNVDKKPVFSSYEKGIQGVAYTNPPAYKSYTSTSADKLTIKWDKVKGASGYMVYRKTESEKSYTRIATVEGNGITSYTDTKLKTCTEYSYKLKSYRTVDGKKIQGYLGDRVALYTHPAQPGLKSTKSLGYNTIQINWTESQGATGYIICRKTTGGYHKVGEVSGRKTLTYKDTTAVTGVKYTYTVRAFSEKNKSRQYSTYKNYIYGTAIPATPQNVEIINLGYTSLEVKWKNVDGATGYEIFRKKSSAASFSKTPYTTVGGTKTTFIDNSVSCGQEYDYAVKALRLEDNKETKSNMSGSKKGIPMTTAPTVKVSKNDYKSLTVSWSLVSGADGYRVYYKKGNGKSWTKLATFNSATLSSCVHSGLTTGTSYSYTVRGYHKNTDANVWGEYDNKGVSNAPMTASPKLVSAKSAGYNQIKIEWKPVDGATGYKIYRKKDGATSWSSLDSVSGNASSSYTDKNANCGEKFTYTVRSYRTVKSKTYYGLYNKNGISALSIPETPNLSVVSTNYNKIKLNWSRCYGATGYKIYRKAAGGNYYFYVRVSSQNVTTYTDTVDCGVEYHYYVTAYKTVDKVEYGSYDSAQKSCKAVPQTPTLVSLTSNSKGTATLTWDAVTGASGYHIYVKEPGGTYRNVVDTDQNKLTYTDQNLESGKKYTYTVVAYRICTAGYINSLYNKTGLTVTVK